MAVDDNPVEALRKHLDREDASRSPVSRVVAQIVSTLPLSWGFEKALAAFGAHHTREDAERTTLMLEVMTAEMHRHEEILNELAENIDANRTEEFIELILDGARKAEATRSRERIKRIGTILANAAAAPSLDSDEVEEMMRVAMNLDDNDVQVLRELVRVYGPWVEKYGRVERHNAHAMWESGVWGSQVDGELEGTCSKLESFGLISRIAPPNNLNVFADFQNRYVLLPRGLRFARFVERRVTDS